MINSDWDDLLKDEIKKQYFVELINKIQNEYQCHTVYPKFENIFFALKSTSYKNVKVVIIGQDPYHNFNQAHGLSFSVPSSEKIPKSLHNIFIELNNDLGILYPSHGNLTNWANQGVLLLNTVLTVRENQPKSHKNMGWETFTDRIITIVNNKDTPVVFLLWGNDAKMKEKLITNKKHLILKSAHPSPLSAFRGFFGCKHFSKTNDFLIKNKLTPIDWNII